MTTTSAHAPLSKSVLTVSTPVFAVLLLTACAATTSTAPYPSFVQADELPDVFLAGLPGVRAKRFAGDAKTRRSSSRLDLPPDWEFSTGGFPDKSVEIYVLRGTLKLGELALRAGGYAYLPDGSVGVPMSTDAGARVLYFLDDATSAAVIRTPLITNRELVPWVPLSGDPNDAGLSIKELRRDPGSGATTFLVRVERGATVPWQSLSVLEEGYLLEGQHQHSECVDGESVSGEYLPGGYYYRPADAVNGGPVAAAEASVWYVRRLAPGQRTYHDGCSAE